MAQHNTSDQNESVADLEAELAASRERLGRNIDELVFRAQPKNIIAEQKAQLRLALKRKYHSLMGTSQEESYTPTGTAASGPSVVDGLKAKAADLKEQATAKAAEVKDQAATKAADLKGHGADDAAQPAGTVTFAGTPDATGTADAKPLTRSDYKVEHSAGSDLGTQVRVKADQARLRLDELTHTEDGELRTDRVATALAATGAVLVGLGAARRASS